jgi:hypothetical protein
MTISSPLYREALMGFASKYIWWKTPEEATQYPLRVIAQVMNIGDYEDVQELAGRVGDEVLREALTRAEIGQFSARSWAYWHIRLGLAGFDSVPPMPTRSLG